MFDTHAHLNFSRFKKNLDEVIDAAKAAGVEHITVPGTDIVSSEKAIEIASKHEGIYAAVGIHPHHLAPLVIPRSERDEGSSPKDASLDSSIVLLEGLLQNDKVVAVGEIGLDRHIYQDTKYQNYQVDESFMDLQKEYFVEQLKLAVTYKKSVIVHNREAKVDLLPLLTNNWDPFFKNRVVFHCCEPDEELLEFAKERKIFIGIDGDVTWGKSSFAKASADKAEFIKQVPLEMLVLETDSPFLLPEPLRSQKLYPNSPANLPLIAEFIAHLRNESVEVVQRQTTANAITLFEV